MEGEEAWDVMRVIIYFKEQTLVPVVEVGRAVANLFYVCSRAVSESLLSVNS